MQQDNRPGYHRFYINAVVAHGWRFRYLTLPRHILQYVPYSVKKDERGRVSVGRGYGISPYRQVPAASIGHIKKDSSLPVLSIHLNIKYRYSPSGNDSFNYVNEPGIFFFNKMRFIWRCWIKRRFKKHNFISDNKSENILPAIFYICGKIILAM